MGHKATIGFATTLEYSESRNIKVQKSLRAVPALSSELKTLFSGIETSEVFGKESLYKNFAGIRRKK